MLEAIRQTKAILALDGFHPTADSHALDVAVIEGFVTSAQCIAQIVEYVKEHKTMDGFLASRPWGKDVVLYDDMLFEASLAII